MPTRLLIADDHGLFRDGLSELLSKTEFRVVAQASNGRDAIRLAQQHQPEVALLDISMPGLNGVDTTREVLRVSPSSRVIVLTMHRESEYVIVALRAGARGYLIKTQPGAELIHALREVAHGEIYVVPELWRTFVESFQSGQALAVDGTSPLTPREREVLQLIAEGKTTKEVAATLHLSFKTAESHRTRIMSKLDIHETAGLVRYAIRNGMIEA